MKWLNALRLAHVAVRAGIFAKKKDDIIMDEEEVKSWLEHFDSSTSPERLEAVFASFKKLNEAESVEDVVRYASELLGDLYDIATECKRLDRLDVLKFYTKYYHLQLISTWCSSAKRENFNNVSLISLKLQEYHSKINAPLDTRL